MKFGILGALKQEVEFILALMSNHSSVEHGGLTYYSGTLNQHSVVLTCSGMGKVAAASAATSLITYFHVDEVIVTGFAGGLSDKLNIGDIVISNALYYHDMDAQPLYAKHEVPGTHLSSFHADSLLVSTASNVIQRFLNGLESTVAPQLLEQLNFERAPQCHIGTIATGDQFIQCKDQAQQIIDARPDTLALEMEGAAVAQVCYNHKTPFIIIRIITDLADQNAMRDFKTFIHTLAKTYSPHLVPAILSNTRAHATLN